MGIITSFFSGGGRTDDPDPTTGLTSRDVYLIQQSWGVLRKNFTFYGVKLLILYFEKYPNSQDYFPFKDIKDLKVLEKNKKFQAHCNNVMHSVDAIVENLTDIEILLEILVKLGKSHQRHGIPAIEFTNLKGVLLDLLATQNNQTTIDSWDKALKVAFGVISKELKN